MTDQKLLLLKRHPVTDGLTSDELQVIANDCDLVDVPTDQSLHRAGDPLDCVYLIARGRFRQTVVDELGNEVLRGFLPQGSQFGGLSAVFAEPVPISITAHEPSIAIRIDHQVFLKFAAAIPRLLTNFLRLLGGMLKQTLRIDRVHRQPKAVVIIHDSPASYPLTIKLIDRLQKLGEQPCLLTVNPSRKERSDVPQLMLFENGEWIDDAEARRQITEWSTRERVFLELTSDAGIERLKAATELAEEVLLCLTPTAASKVTSLLRQLIDCEPRWREKVRLVWVLDESEWYPPPITELAELVAGDFKVSFSDPPTNFGNVWKNGIERIVHELRGLRVGLALGGGAARGMAHLGVLKTLEQNGIIVDMIAGTSAGSMTGTLYASGMEMDHAVESFVRDLKPSWFFSSIPGGNYWYLLYKYRRRQFDPMLRKYLSDLRFEQLPIPMNSITVDLVSGRPRIRDRGDAVRGIVESINLPGLAKPICHDGEALVDGGLVNNVPADVLVSKGCNFVIAVSVTAKLEQRFGSIVPNSSARNDKSPSVPQTILRGYLVQSVNMNSVGVQPADFVIEPDVTTFDLAEFTRADEMAAIGEETTRTSIERIRQSLSSLDSKLFRPV